MILTKDKSLTVDYVICFAVFIQSALLIMQAVMVAVFGIDPEETTLFRVVFTAIPMVIAMAFSFYRKPYLFLGVFFAVLALLGLHTLLFPQNAEYIWNEAPRFLLPVVIPSALCIITVKKAEVVEKVALFMSWVTAGLILIYIVSFFLGIFSFERYNMSFGYGCLLPMMMLYYRKRPFTVLMSFIILLIVVAFGSRGATLIFVGYVIIDLFLSRSRFRWLVLSIGVLVIILLPLFENSLESLGITSRTLNYLEEGKLSQSEGRQGLFSLFINELRDYPVTGIGLYGDRVETGGSYCHNILLEILLDFGLIIGIIALICLILLFGRTFCKLKGSDRNLYLVFLFYGLGPLMASSSYLKVNYLALLIGFSILIRRRIKEIHGQSKIAKKVPFSFSTEEVDQSQ